jgi:hypothetical protein
VFLGGMALSRAAPDVVREGAGFEEVPFANDIARAVGEWFASARRWGIATARAGRQEGRTAGLPERITRERRDRADS